MLAQVTLTPAESKKLIAKAIAQMDVVKQALKRGLIVLHPSSSTYFVVEELTGSRPKTNVWVCGVIVPKAACMEMGALVESSSPKQEQFVTPASTPEAFRFSWVIRKGSFETGLSLAELFAEMGPQDIYVKGVNALDTEGTVGVLFGSLAGEGGTFGRAVAASKRQGFKLLFPVGLEKLVPVPVKQAAKEAKRHGYDYAMGIPCGLFPCDSGIVVTEIKAIEILSGATAIPIAAGGLMGAEGAITLVLKGDKEQVSKAIDYAEQSKGARLPPVRVCHCEDCPSPICDFPVRGKPWVIA